MAIEEIPQEDEQTVLRNQEIKRGFDGILDDVNRKLMSPEFHKSKFKCLSLKPRKKCHCYSAAQNSTR